MTALALLRRAVEALRRTDPTAGADAADVVEALANGAPPAALGLCTPPRRRRDDLIRELARVLAPGASPWRAADALATYATRYRATAWRVDQHSTHPPADCAKSLLWRALKCDAGFPDSRRQIYNILSRRTDAEDIAA